MKLEGKSYPKRVFLPKGSQQRLLLLAMNKLDLPETKLAHLLGIHRRTLNGWKREDYLMTYPAFEKVHALLHIPLPSGVKIQAPFWYTNKGSEKGWKTMKKRYGRVPVDEEQRKKKWEAWWHTKGKYQPHSSIGVRKNFDSPMFSEELAEFVGIMLGDGGLTPRQVHVAMHRVVDQEYAFYVKGLIENLFKVPVKTSERVNIQLIQLVVSRTGLVEFCRDVLGLRVGHKLNQGIDIPAWIKSNSEFLKGCIRGLVDTDGCVFHERHKIRGKAYSYPRLNFVTYSPVLAQSFFEGLKQLGMNPRIRRRGKAIQLESREEIRQYFDVVGSHNPKHLKRLLAG